MDTLLLLKTNCKSEGYGRAVKMFENNALLNLGEHKIWQNSYFWQNSQNRVSFGLFCTNILWMTDSSFRCICI